MKSNDLTASRDPRFDPRAGDVLQICKWPDVCTYNVLGADGGGVSYRICGEHVDRFDGVSREIWEAAMRSAHVLYTHQPPVEKALRYGPREHRIWVGCPDCGNTYHHALMGSSVSAFPEVCDVCGEYGPPDVGVVQMRLDPVLFRPGVEWNGGEE